MQSVDNGFYDVGVSLFEGLEDAHQHGLCFGTLNSAVAITVFT